MYVFDFEEFSMSKKHNSNNDWIFMDPDLILGVEPVCCKKRQKIAPDQLLV